MKKSVIIIANNEERNIDKCIKSILNQTIKPDEIILVAHNCTDETINIASKYPITVIKYEGVPGIVNARLKSLEYSTGDIILCIDGDSYAKNNWVEIMSNLLKNNILVGSWVELKGSLLSKIMNVINKYNCVSKNEQSIPWIWGSSFAFWKKDKMMIKNILEKSIEISKRLNLSRNPEDYWISSFMNKTGNIEVTNKTNVTQHIKEKGLIEEIIRNIQNIKNGAKIKYFLKNNKI